MEVIEQAQDPGFSKLKRIISDRHANEKNMAEQLLVAFNQEPKILTLLRNHVKTAARQIITLCELRGGRVVFEKAYGDARNYEWVRSKGLTTYELFWRFIRNEANFNQFDASQCSDIIRFYGEITEAAADFPKLAREWISEQKDFLVYSDLISGGPRENYEIYKIGKRAVKTQKAYQRSAGMIRNPWDISYGTVPDGSHWGKSAKAGGRRLRVKTQDGQVRLDDENRMETAAEARKRMELVRKYRDEMTASERAIVAMKAGVSRWMQLDNDTTNKMNRVFGLAHGATISGTTTDTLYFFDQVTAQTEYFGKMVPLSQRFNKATIEPLCYMLPLATIVGKGHHSTIEVALPLNLNLQKRFGYSIGRYKTLKPKDMGDKWGEKIDTVLATAHEKAANSLVLIYYKQDSKEYEGYVKCDPDSVWDELALGDARLVNMFKRFPPYPTKRDIGRLHLKVNHALFAGPGDTRTFRQKRDFWENR